MLAEIYYSPWALEHPSGIWATLVGLILLVVLAKPLGKFLGVPAMGEILTNRSKKIETDTLQVERQLSDIAQLRNDYANRIQMIEKEQRERIAAAVRDADNARADIIAEAQETARLLQRRGEEEMGREHTRQRILMRQQIVQITLDAAEQAVRAQNSDQMQRQLIQDFIGRIAGEGTVPGNGSLPAPIATASSQIVAPAPVAATPLVPTLTPVPTVTSVAPLLSVVSTSDVPLPVSTPGAVAYSPPSVAPNHADTNLTDFSAFNPSAEPSSPPELPERGEA